MGDGKSEKKTLRDFNISRILDISSHILHYSPSKLSSPSDHAKSWSNHSINHEHSRVELECWVNGDEGGEG